MKFKLISDGSISGTNLVNAETNEVVGVVEGVRLEMVVGVGVAAKVRLELTGELHRRKDRPPAAFTPEAPTHPGKANAIPPPPSTAAFPKEAPTKPTPKPGRYIQAEGALSVDVVPMGMPPDDESKP
jgi:hypothetical protein